MYSHSKHDTPPDEVIRSYLVMDEEDARFTKNFLRKVRVVFIVLGLLLVLYGRDRLGLSLRQKRGVAFTQKSILLTTYAVTVVDIA